MITDRQVSFPSLHADPLTIPARLRVPEAARPHPAVVILHGTEGPSEREAAYAEALNGAGFVTLEPDHRSPRLVGDDVAERPSIHETLPDLFAARRFLATRDEVDPGRIGVLGFGFGGAVVLLAATNLFHRRFTGDGGFAGFLAFYPACHRFNRVPGFELADLVWAPILLATASLDGYDNDPDAGPALVRSMPPLDRAKVRTAVFYGVHHGFDLPGPERQAEDANANRGAGGRVTLAHDPTAAGRARGLAVQFFREMRERPNPLRPRGSEAWRFSPS